MKALRLNGHEELLGYRLGEELLKMPLRTDRLVSYVESKSGTPGSYLLMDEGGARWAAKTLATMETAHVTDRELLISALSELIEEWELASSIAAELRPLLNWHAGHRMESGK